MLNVYAVQWVTAYVCNGWTGFIRSLTPSSSSYRCSATTGSSGTLRDAVPSPTWMRNGPHEWTLVRRIRWTLHRGGGGCQDSLVTDITASVCQYRYYVEDTAVHLIWEHEIAGFVLNQGLAVWLFLFYIYIPSMLKYIGFGLLLVILLLQGYGVWL